MSTTVTAAATAGGGLLGVLAAQLVPRRKVKLDEFQAIIAELRKAIDDLRAEVADKARRIVDLEHEVQACEQGRAADRVATMERITELSLALARSPLPGRDS